MTNKKLYVGIATITKFQKQEDGSLIVYGKFTDESLDSDRQKVDLKWAAKAIQEWFETGANVRVMHSHLLYPAGKGVTIEVKEDGVYGSVRVIDPTAIKLVEGGALQGFSIGISDLHLSFHDISAPKGTIDGGKIFEISLVDRPANPSAYFAAVKSATKITNPWRFAKTEEGLRLEKMATTEEVATDKNSGWLSVLAPVHALLCKGSDEASREAHADAFANAAGVLSGPAVKTTIHEMLAEAVSSDDVDATERLSRAYKGLADVITFGETSPFDLDAVKKGENGDGLASALGAIHDAIAEAIPGICDHEEPDEDDEPENAVGDGGGDADDVEPAAEEGGEEADKGEEEGNPEMGSDKAVLNAEAEHKIPDEHFAYIASDGSKHLPVEDEEHVRNALARFTQTEFESDAKKKEAAHIIAARAKELGVEVDPKSPVGVAAGLHDEADKAAESEEGNEEEARAEVRSGAEEQSDQEDHPLSEAAKAAVADLVKVQMTDFIKELEAVKAENLALKADVERLGSEGDYSRAPRRNSSEALKRATEARTPESMRSFKSFLSSVAGSDASVFANETARAVLADIQD